MAAVAFALLAGGFLAGHAYVWTSYGVMGDGAPIQDCVVEDLFLTWSTPGLFAASTGAAELRWPGSHHQLPVAETDPWGRFPGEVSWSQVQWEDHHGQTIELQAIGNNTYVSGHLDTGYQERLTWFLGLITDLSGDDVERLSDRVWDSRQESGKDIQGRFVRSLWHPVDFDLALDALVARVGPQLVFHDVGTWHAVAGDLTLQVHVEVRDMTVNDVPLRVDAGDRVEGGRTIVEETMLLGAAQQAIQAATDLAVEAPRFKADVFCWDTAMTQLV